MTKSLKIASVITIFVLLLTLFLMAAFAVTAKTAFAAENVTVTLTAYLNAPISTSSGAPTTTGATKYSQAEIVLKEISGDSPASYTATVADGVYTFSVPQQYSAAGASHSVYHIYYKTAGTDSFVRYNASGSLVQISTSGTIDHPLFFYSVTLQDAGLPDKTIISHYKSTVTLPKVGDVSSASLGDNSLFKEWSGGIRNGGTVYLDSPMTLTAIRVAIDKTRFDIDPNNILTVYGIKTPTEDNSYISGKIEFSSFSSLMEAIDSFGDSTKTLKFNNCTIAQSISVPADGNITITGNLHTTVAGGAFRLTDGGTLTLQDAKIHNSSSNNNGIMLDTGEVVLKGDVITGGIVVTKETATSGTLTFTEGTTTEESIPLLYVDNKDMDYKKINSSDVGQNLLNVSGDVAANFSLANGNEKFNLNYNGTSLYIEEKFYVKYEVTEGVTYKIDYMFKYDVVKVLDGTGFTKRGHDFMYWVIAGGSGTKLYANSDLTIENDITLRAYFEPRKYTVEFKGIALDNMTHTYGTDTVIPTPEKEGFIFEGWMQGDTKLETVDGKITIGAEDYDSATNRTITLEAQLKLKAPTDVVPTSYSGEYDGEEHSLTVSASHELTTVSYLKTWDAGSSIPDELVVKNVTDSGTYTCTVIAYIQDQATKTIYYSDSVTVTATASITPIPLKIAIDPQEKKEGEEDPPFTFQIVEGALATGEGISILGIKMSRQAGEEIGTYTIEVISSSNSNYDIKYAAADLTIVKDNLILIIVLPSVLGGLALISAGVFVGIVIYRRRKKTTKQPPQAFEPKASEQDMAIKPELKKEARIDKKAEKAAKKAAKKAAEEPAKIVENPQTKRDMPPKNKSKKKIKKKGKKK